jgi:hypothetical protein
LADLLLAGRWINLLAVRLSYRTIRTAYSLGTRRAILSLASLLALADQQDKIYTIHTFY